MKTCKTGCGKMKAGGSVKKVKKMATGGQALNKAKGFAKAQTGGDNVKMGIYGMSNAGTTGPNRTAGYDYKKGGTAKSSGCPPGWYKSGSDCFPSNKPFYSTGSKIGVGSIIAGTIGTGIKKMVDKRKAKKEADAAAKKAIIERAESKPKGKFGMSVGVKASCKNGMVRGADGKCVMSRPKFQKGGSFGMLSVKTGVDKNPNPTAADRIAGAKMNKKKIGGSIKRK
jgi:hypothetical protein